MYNTRIEIISTLWKVDDLVLQLEGLQSTYIPAFIRVSQ